MESNKPGSATSTDTTGKFDREWYRIKLRYDKYFNAKKKFKYGFMVEAVYSNQPFFSNYSSTLLSAPGFTPTPESQTIFRSKYRAHEIVSNCKYQLLAISGDNWVIVDQED